MTSFDRLRELAEKATPGPWEQAGRTKQSSRIIQWAPEKFVASTLNDSENGEQETADAAYIAATNPAAILELLALVASQQSAIAELKRQAENEVKWMPLMDTPLAIRFDALSEQQALNNHGQTLYRLCSRGGLACCEALAVAQERSWRKTDAVAAFSALSKLPPQNVSTELSELRQSNEELALRAATANKQARFHIDRDICEHEPYDPDKEDSICIKHGDLLLVLENRLP